MIDAVSLRGTTELSMPGKERGRRRGRSVVLGVLVVVFVVLLGGVDMVVRSDKQAKVADATDRDAVPSVEVFRPQHQARPGTLSLPGNAQAWYEAPIRAQVSGYLRMWYKDIGAQVKAGDLLGEIDAPEVDQQLNQAKAALQVAVANEKLAIVTASRWQHLVASNAVSQQSTDVATSDAAAKHAATVAAEANVDRLVALEKFKRLVAPFNGIVTVRRTDVGALIKADEVPGPELFAVADIHAMRVYVRVPQAYASQVHVGMQAKLHLPDYPGRTFSAKVITKAHQIDEDSRTMLVELEAPNPDGVLSPGSFATVDFDLKPNLDALYVPSSALIFRQQGMQVAIVGKDDRIEMKNISIGRDDGATVEVVNGIAAEDRIVDKPADTLSNDEKVQVTVDRSKPDHGGASAKAEP